MSGHVQARAEFDPMGREGAVLSWPSEPPTWIRVPDGQVPSESLLSLRLDEEVARALYDALARYFGGAFDSTQLRRDYDAERKRVDLLIGNLIGGAR